MNSDREWLVILGVFWLCMFAAFFMAIGMFIAKQSNAVPKKAEPLEAIPLEDEDDDGDLDPETRLLKYPDSWKDPR